MRVACPTLFSSRRGQVTIDSEKDGIWEYGGMKIRDLNLAITAFYGRVTNLSNSLVHIRANGLAEGRPFTSHPS